jgi:zinc D-Ala-D-Ala carboxypeptidase
MTDHFRYFKVEDFACQETGENKISLSFISRLDDLREACGFPFYVTSGYRSPNHSIEKKKAAPGGTHAQGIAADIKVNNGIERRKVVKEAIRLGFNGVGVAKSFVHVDIRKSDPVLWTY